jgi:hypothetical protein
MALKRLDEEFELKPGTQLLPYMKRLLPSLEGRFQDIEKEQDIVAALTEEIRAAALLRMNEILIPATQDIIAVTKLGFMLGPVSTTHTLVMGYMTMNVDEGPQRTSFTPSPYVIVEHSVDDYAIARVGSYTQSDGLIELTITAIHGNPGPHSTWMISSTPGMADSTKLYHDAVGPMYDEIVVDYADILIKHQEIIDAAEALAESGLDVFAFIRRDGAVDFIAPQKAVHPVASSNDQTIPTTAWSRARMIEYLGNAVSRGGDTMLGPLNLNYMPTQPAHATNKAYVDSVIGAGGVINSSVTLQTTNPTLRLVPSGAQQNRMIEARSSSNVTRWVLALADGALESGGEAGSNFTLARYRDAGTLIDVALQVSRQTGILSTKGINFAGAVSGVGDVSVVGDLWAYRPASTTTGMLYMNQARNAYHYFNGTNHQFTGGGIDCGGSPLTSGHVNCYSVYTQGYGVTCWGLTSHGAVAVNSTLNANSLQINSTGPIIQMQDTDWGPMYVHHQSDLIGFLNNGGGWIHYITNAGHMWTAQYGWLHDYVNGRASAYAWDAANYRYNQLVSAVRWAYIGDLGTSWSGYGLGEPYGGSAITGWQGYNGYNMYVQIFRFRQLQYCVAGGWYASWFA